MTFKNINDWHNKADLSFASQSKKQIEVPIIDSHFSQLDSINSDDCTKSKKKKPNLKIEDLQAEKKVQSDQVKFKRYQIDQQTTRNTISYTSSKD